MEKHSSDETIYLSHSDAGWGPIVSFLQRHAAVVLIASLLILLPLIALISRRSSSNDPATNWDTIIASQQSGDIPYTCKVPFLFLHDANPWRSVSHALASYESELHTILIRLSQSLEVCLQSEQHWKVGPILSDAIETRIKVLSNVMEQNVQVLRDFLLKNEMKVTFMLPARPWSTHFQPTWQSTPFSTSSSSSAYTSMTQLMAHLVRDWSNEGEAVRQSVYGWCLQQLSCPNDNKLRILVPGAGLARLAWDLACQGHAVEANEVSLPMAVSAHQILHSPKTVRVYPFLTDGWVNEANSELRYQPMDIHPPDWSVPVHLSYTVGDFLEVYGSATNPSSFDVVLTVFFLDTAPNILDYLILIFNLLKPGGKWIHVGPLQWHMEAQIYPAANELERVIQSLGFHIQHWSIDDTAMDYRLQEHTTRRSTKFEGYHPLRMVAVKETVGKQEYRPN